MQFPTTRETDSRWLVGWLTGYAAAAASVCLTRSSSIPAAAVAAVVGLQVLMVSQLMQADDGARRPVSTSTSLVAFGSPRALLLRVSFRFSVVASPCVTQSHIQRYA